MERNYLSITSPFLVTVVLAIFAGFVWILLSTFGFLSPSFLHIGPGRSPTVFDTASGKKLYNEAIIRCNEGQAECQLGRVNCTVVSLTCLADMQYYQTQLAITDSDAVLYFAGKAIDTWGRWFALILLAFVNYFLNFIGLNVVQTWLVTVIQDPDKSSSTSKNGVLLIRTVWILFEFTIYYMDILLALTQIDMFFASILGYVCGAWLLTPYFMELKGSPPSQFYITAFPPAAPNQPAVFIPEHQPYTVPNDGLYPDFVSSDTSWLPLVSRPTQGATLYRLKLGVGNPEALRL